MVLEATLAFFPSQRPFRAIVKTETKTHNHWPATRLEIADWTAAQAALAKELSQYPWVESSLYFLKSLQLIHVEERWYLTDTNQALMPLHPEFSEQQRWLLLAITGGHSCPTAVLRKRDAVLPLGVLVKEGYKSI